jgi:hypothetical protein
MKSLDEQRNRKSYQSLEEASRQDINKDARWECFHDRGCMREALNNPLLKFGSALRRQARRAKPL